jgi:hypothetical protein
MLSSTETFESKNIYRSNGIEYVDGRMIPS